MNVILLLGLLIVWSFFELKKEKEFKSSDIFNNILLCIVLYFISRILFFQYVPFNSEFLEKIFKERIFAHSNLDLNFFVLPILIFTWIATFYISIKKLPIWNWLIVLIHILFMYICYKKIDYIWNSLLMIDIFLVFLYSYTFNVKVGFFDKISKNR